MRSGQQAVAHCGLLTSPYAWMGRRGQSECFSERAHSLGWGGEGRVSVSVRSSTVADSSSSAVAALQSAVSLPAVPDSCTALLPCPLQVRSAPRRAPALPGLCQRAGRGIRCLAVPRRRAAEVRMVHAERGFRHSWLGVGRAGPMGGFAHVTLERGRAGSRGGSCFPSSTHYVLLAVTPLPSAMSASTRTTSGARQKRMRGAS